jgi:hypothetical protein
MTKLRLLVLVLLFSRLVDISIIYMEFEPQPKNMGWKWSAIENIFGNWGGGGEHFENLTSYPKP